MLPSRLKKDVYQQWREEEPSIRVKKGKIELNPEESKRRRYSPIIFLMTNSLKRSLPDEDADSHHLTKRPKPEPEPKIVEEEPHSVTFTITLSSDVLDSRKSDTPVATERRVNTGM